MARYMLPLVPIFAILGAAFLVRGMVWARHRYGDRPVRGVSVVRKAQRYVFPALGVASVVFAFLWAVAFANIYTQPHSRVPASAWIFNNVPDGSSISKEGWDDDVPFNLPSEPGKPPYDFGAHGYTRTVFDLYDDRPPEQAFQYIRDQMGATDYIVLASNRLYGSIPRLPWRYPVVTRFYQLLFAGKLGYQLVHTSQPVPELLGIKINDQLADESFTVYDHPRVDVFKKTSELTEDQLRILFSTSLDRPPGEYSTQRHGKVTDDRSLMYERTLNEMPVVGDFQWNPHARSVDGARRLSGRRAALARGSVPYRADRAAPHHDCVPAAPRPRVCLFAARRPGAARAGVLRLRLEHDRRGRPLARPCSSDQASRPLSGAHRVRSCDPVGDLPLPDSSRGSSADHPARTAASAPGHHPGGAALPCGRPHADAQTTPAPAPPSSDKGASKGSPAGPTSARSR